MWRTTTAEKNVFRLIIHSLDMGVINSEHALWDQKRQFVNVHEEPIQVVSCNCDHVLNITGVSEDPQIAGVHSFQTASAKWARLWPCAPATPTSCISNKPKISTFPSSCLHCWSCALKCCHYLLNLLWREKGLPHSTLAILNWECNSAIPFTVALETHGMAAIRKCNLSVALHADATLVLTFQVHFGHVIMLFFHLFLIMLLADWLLFHVLHCRDSPIQLLQGWIYICWWWLPWHYNKQEVRKKPMIGSSACPHFQVQLLLQNS